MTTSLTTPLTDGVIDGLMIGEHVTFSGVIFTARDAAHKRLIEMAGRGEDHLRDQHGRDDDDGARDVGQHVTEEDARGRLSERPRRDDVLEAPHSKRLRPHDARAAGIPRPAS